jgi:GMP synthase-like glutamine amidotransferase
MALRTPLNLIVLQHAAVEHPGIFADFFREDGFEMHTVELDEGEPIPDLERFDVMIVMGGPQDVWQEDQHAWLRPEKEAIRKFVADMQRPYLGVCLGHQLLADSLGGRVVPGNTPEIGVLAVSRTSAGKSDPVFSDLPSRLKVLQWHGAEVTAVPDGAAVMASSEVCPIQAFRYGPHAYGLQFHMEVNVNTVAAWAAIPEYARSLEEAMGANGVQQLEQQVSSELSNFNRDARALYDRLKDVWTA